MWPNVDNGASSESTRVVSKRVLWVRRLQLQAEAKPAQRRRGDKYKSTLSRMPSLAHPRVAVKGTLRAELGRLQLEAETERGSLLQSRRPPLPRPSKRSPTCLSTI